MKTQLEEIRKHFIDCLSIDFGHVWVTEEIQNWPKLSWTGLLKELSDQEINLQSSLNRCWFNFFMVEKEKYNLLKTLSSRKYPFERLGKDNHLFSRN